MPRRRAFALVSALLVSAFVACGGKVVFEPTSTTSGAGGTSASTSSSSSATGSTGTSGTTGTTSGTTTSGSTTTTTTTTSSGAGGTGPCGPCAEVLSGTASEACPGPAKMAYDAFVACLCLPSNCGSMGAGGGSNACTPYCSNPGIPVSADCTTCATAKATAECKTEFDACSNN